MRQIPVAVIALTLFSPVTMAQSGPGTVVGQTHYETVDCNAISTRQAMLKEYNESLPSNLGIHAIDVQEQSKVSATANAITCYGTYSFSDGSTAKVTYKEMINSLGQTVWTFTPDT